MVVSAHTALPIQYLDFVPRTLAAVILETLSILSQSDVVDAAASVPNTLGGDLMDPKVWIERFGAYVLWGICAIIFVETGLLFPFLPGDSLLFTAGMFTAQEAISTPLWLLCIVVFIAAFGGDQLSYVIGRTIGHKLFKNPHAKVLKPQYIEQAHEFFEKYGGRAIVLARFVPIVRTYAPVSAGMAYYSYRSFVMYNLIGAAVWGIGVTLIGYALGNVPFVQTHFEKIILGIVFLSVVPVVIEYVRAQYLVKKTEPQELK